jgi:hypothetical protein
VFSFSLLVLEVHVGFEVLTAVVMESYVPEDRTLRGSNSLILTTILEEPEDVQC